MRNFLFFFIIATTLTGCATGYHPYQWNGGYKDTKLEQNKYEIQFVGNGPSSIEEVTKFWHQRAEELCPEGYEYKYFDEKENSALWLPAGTVMIPIYIYHPEINGIVNCKIAER